MSRHESGTSEGVDLSQDLCGSRHWPGTSKGIGRNQKPLLVWVWAWVWNLWGNKNEPDPLQVWTYLSLGTHGARDICRTTSKPGTSSGADPNLGLQKQLKAGNLGQSRPEEMNCTLGWSRPVPTNFTGVGLNQLLKLEWMWRSKLHGSRNRSTSGTLADQDWGNDLGQRKPETINYTGTGIREQLLSERARYRDCWRSRCESGTLEGVDLNQDHYGSVYESSISKQLGLSQVPWKSGYESGISK